MSNYIQLEDIELYTSCCVERNEREVQKRENRAVFIGKYQISFAGVTALILGFDDSMLSQRLLINALLKSCISVLFMILVELVSMWLGSLCKDSPRFY